MQNGHRERVEIVPAKEKRRKNANKNGNKKFFKVNEMNVILCLFEEVHSSFADPRTKEKAKNEIKKFSLFIIIGK